MVTPLSLTLDTTTLSMERYCTLGLGVGFGRGVGVGGTGDGCLPPQEVSITITPIKKATQPLDNRTPNIILLWLLCENESFRNTLGGYYNFYRDSIFSMVGRRSDYQCTVYHL